MIATAARVHETAKKEKPSATRAPAGARVPWSEQPDSEECRFTPAGVRQAAGNFAVQRFLRAGAIQAKLAVSAPGDAYEQEADRAADSVMRMPGVRPGSAPLSHGAVAPGKIQRKCACEENAGAGGGCDSCRERELNIQRRAAGHGGATDSPKVHDAAPKVHEALRS